MRGSTSHPRLFAALCLLAALPAAVAARADPPTTTPDLPLSELPYTPVLEPAFLDRTADPCVDFYAYTCGGWQKRNPIPADQSSWSVYGKWGNEVNRYLWALLTDLTKPSWKRTSSDKQLGEYFASCMDEAALEKRGAAPLAPALQALTAVKDPASLAHVADLGGLLLAYRAWKTVTQGQDLRPKDGLTPDQRFFVGYAQWACENTRPEKQRLLARTDPHSPARYRVNGLVVNIPEFAQAFSCKPGQPMVKEPKDVCRVW